MSESEIRRFLGKIKVHPRASKINTKLLAEFIQKQAEVNELTSWTVALVSHDTAGTTPKKIAGHPVCLIERDWHPAAKENSATLGWYVIRRLLSPRDEAIDLDLDQYQEAFRKTQEAFTADPGRSDEKEPPDEASGPMIRDTRSKERGLLLIYPLAPEGKVETNEVPVMGFGISFPGSKSGKRVTYIVNNIYATQEFGGDS